LTLDYRKLDSSAANSASGRKSLNSHPILEYSQFFSAAAFRDVVVIRSQALTRITCAVRATVE
jgi:hypothetical protein